MNYMVEYERIKNTINWSHTTKSSIMTCALCPVKLVYKHNWKTKRFRVHTGYFYIDKKPILMLPIKEMERISKRHYEINHKEVMDFWLSSYPKGATVEFCISSWEAESVGGEGVTTT